MDARDTRDAGDAATREAAALIAAWNAEGGLMSEAQLAEYLAIDPSTVRDWANRGLTPPRLQIGPRTFRYSKADAARWLAQLREQAATG